MPGLDPVVFLSPSSIGTAIEVTVASLASPTELNSRAASQGDLVITRTVAAGTDDCVIYYADTTSDAEALPYIVSSSTSGVKFVAIAGRYRNGTEAIAALTASRIVTTDASKNLETPATVTTSQAVALNGTTTVVDGSFSIVGSGDPTKTIKFEVDAQTAADDLTINSGAQTDDRTATFPVLTGNSILTLSNATLTTTRIPFATTNGILTDSADLTWNGSTLAVTGAITASTTITATTRVIGIGAPVGVYGVETNGGMASYNTTTDTNARYAIATRRVANTSASGTHNARAISGELFGTIASGQTNSGVWSGLWYEALRNYVATGDTGTLTLLEGARLTYGHFNTDASTPTTTTITGLSLIGYRSSGIIGAMIGIDISNGSTTQTPTIGYGIRIANVVGATAFAISTGTGLVSIGDTTDSTSKDTGSIVTEGGIGVEKAIVAGTSIRSVSPTAGVGYATGAGGTVAQGSGSGKATGVTLNTVCGTITMDGATLNADTTVAFTFTNSAIAATDLVVIQHSSVGTLGAYNFAVTPAGGSATVSVRNVTPGNLAEAIVLRFAIIKAVTS